MTVNDHFFHSQVLTFDAVSQSSSTSSFDVDVYVIASSPLTSASVSPLQ